MKLDIYTDGSCWQGDGSWAYVFVSTKKGVDYTIRGAGFESPTTSNRMEMTAIIRAIEKLLETGLKPEHVHVYTDSQYTMNMFNGTWKVRETTKNKDLIARWFEARDKLLRICSLSIDWVRGHDGNKYNEMVDEMCTSEREHGVKTRNT